MVGVAGSGAAAARPAAALPEEQAVNTGEEGERTVFSGKPAGMHWQCPGGHRGPMGLPLCRHALGYQVLLVPWSGHEMGAGLQLA